MPELCREGGVGHSGSFLKAGMRWPETNQAAVSVALWAQMARSLCLDWMAPWWCIPLRGHSVLPPCLPPELWGKYLTGQQQALGHWLLFHAGQTLGPREHVQGRNAWVVCPARLILSWGAAA